MTRYKIGEVYTNGILPFPFSANKYFMKKLLGVRNILRKANSKKTQNFYWEKSHKFLLSIYYSSSMVSHIFFTTTILGKCYHPHFQVQERISEKLYNLRTDSKERNPNSNTLNSKIYAIYSH